MSETAQSRAARERKTPTAAQRRNARKREDQAYAQTGANARERVASYLMRRNRLTAKLRQALSFIEGRWTPKHHTKEDEQRRRQLRYPAAIIMEASRFQGSKVEGKRQASIRAFLTGLFTTAA